MTAPHNTTTNLFSKWSEKKNSFFFLGEDSLFFFNTKNSGGDDENKDTNATSVYWGKGRGAGARMAAAMMADGGRGGPNSKGGRGVF